MSDRAKRIEEAAKALVAWWNLGVDYTQGVECIDALRAALSTPAPEGGDEYRRGVEDASALWRKWVEGKEAIGPGSLDDALRALAPPATDAEVRAFLVAEGIDPDAAVERMRARVKAITGRDLPPASGGDEACKTRTIHGCWCDLPNSHDGPHRSYDDPEPAPASGGDEARCEHDIPLTMRCAWCEHAEARRSSPTDVTNVGCERCGGTRLVLDHDRNPGEPEDCPACGGTGRGHA